MGGIQCAVCDDNAVAPHHRRRDVVPRYTGLPQHWIRDTQPHDRWCAKCERWVSKWHHHHPKDKHGATAYPEIITGPRKRIVVKD